MESVCPRVVLGCAALISPTLSASVSAQDVAPSPAPVAAPAGQTAPTAAAAGEQGIHLQEIVVTAQRRSENLQKVPITVTAVGSAQLKASGVQSSADLAIAVPGINVNQQNTSVHFYVRGVGTTGASAGNESSVAIFVDGVYIPSLSGSVFSLSNIDRIEVLKGPQGTLYGRNATGGAVNLITRTPSQHTEVDADIGYGNYRTVENTLYATTGLTDNLAADISLRYSNQGNGFGINHGTGDDIDKRRSFNVRSKLYWDLPTTKVTLSGDYAKDSGSFGTLYRPYGDTHTIDGKTGFSYGFNDINDNSNPPISIKNYGGSLKVAQDIGSLTLTSISAYRGTASDSTIDIDATPVNLLDVRLKEKDGQFTQELQLASGSGSRLTWIGGLFFLDGYSKYDPFSPIGPGVAPLSAVNILDKQKTLSLAAYAQGTYKITDHTRVTVGGRYTYDRRKLSATEVGLLPAGGQVVLLPEFNAKTSFKKPTWRFAIDQDLSDTELLYASYSRGFKSGLYNLTVPTDPPVKPEVLDAYEVGLKSTLFDRRVRLNISGFYYNYNDIQVYKVISGAQVLFNAAKSRMYGADVDFNAALTRTLSIHGGGEYIHDRYLKFPDAPISVPAAIGNSFNACPPQPEAACDASGNRMINTPDFSGNFGIDWTLPITMGKWVASADYSYNDGFYWDVSNRTHQSAYSLVNAQLRWSNSQDTFHVRAWVRNAFNKKYYQQVTESALGDIAVAADPRTYGMSFGFSFK